MCSLASFFFFNDTATTEIYTLSLHDALPISSTAPAKANPPFFPWTTIPLPSAIRSGSPPTKPTRRSEEHTSELQSRLHLVCRLLLEKKKEAKLDRIACRYNNTRFVMLNHSLD